MQNKTDINHLDHLADLYFSGLTTLEQEQELRQLLAKTEQPDGKTADALAVLSYVATARPRQSRRSGGSRWRIIAPAAASVAVTAILATTLINRNDSSGYLAYVNGSITTEPDRVMQIVDSDLKLLGDAATGFDSEINDELSELSKIINTENKL